MPASKSRLNLARAAIRPAMKGKVMLSGPAGAGKTETALIIAETLAPEGGRILHIDTEKESALTYADLYDFTHLRWSPPFDPRELQDTVLAAGADYDVINIDSFSHFWRGSGGILDIANGRFTGWKDARPAQVDVVEAILEVDAHVIVCCRSKMDHVQEQVGGKQVVRKLGMAAIQDDDLEYEVNVAIEMDMQHTLSIGKSRTNAIPVGRAYPAGHAPEFAAVYRDWLKAGEPVADPEEIRGIVAVLNTIGQEAERVKAKQIFLECFGRPEFILASRLPEAQEWARDHVTALSGGPVQGAATAGADAPVGAPEVSSATDGPGTPDPEPEPAPTDAEPVADGPLPLSPDRVAKFQDSVAKLALSGVKEQLQAANLSSNGPGLALRKRLVEHLCQQALQADALSAAAE